LGRRERDAYRHTLSVYADKVMHGDLENVQLVPSKMPMDKYQAVLDFLELDLFDLLTPPAFDPDAVDVAGLNDEQATQKRNQAKLASEKSRQELFFMFDNFSRGRAAGVMDRIDFQQNIMAFIRIIGHLGKVIHDWAQLEPMNEEEIREMVAELEVQGRRMPTLVTPHGRKELTRD